MLAIVVSLTGCAPGEIDSVTMDTTGSAVQTGSRLAFTVTGRGICGELPVDWGDDSQPDHNTNQSFRFYPLHQYSGWGGGKTVTVHPAVNCGGFARTRFNIAPTAKRRVGWVRDPTRNVNLCNAVPNAPPVPSNSLVHVTGQPTPVVNFGCPLNNCIVNSDGRLGTVAGPAFPFPGMREFSLVMRVGSQLFQGGTNEQFVVPAGGTLEVCQNTDLPAQAVGGWEIDLAVDELGH